MNAFLKRHQIIIFFVLVIVLSWFPWYAGIAPETVTFMPSLLGLGMAFAVGGKQGAELITLSRTLASSTTLLAYCLVGAAVHICYWLGDFH